MDMQLLIIFFILNNLLIGFKIIFDEKYKNNIITTLRGLHLWNIYKVKKKSITFNKLEKFSRHPIKNLHFEKDH